MQSGPFTRSLVAACVPLLLTGCMVGPNFSTPPAQWQSAWEGTLGDSRTPARDVDAHWWKKFNDPTLNRLVESAYANNPGLQAAGVKILQVRAQLNGSVGKLFPQQQFLSASAGTYGPGSTGAYSSGTDFINMGRNIVASQTLFSASWEIDFWGKYRRQIESDRAAYLSTIAAYDAACVTLLADVASTYTNLRLLETRMEITRANIAALREALRIARARMNAGEASMLDVDQSQTELGRVESLLPDLEDTHARTLNALAVLTGVPPAALIGKLESGRLPSPPESLAIGTPKDLLRRRPDVRMAAWEAGSQSARIGVEYANLLPSFSLNGSFGYATSSDAAPSFSNIFNWQSSTLSSAGSLVMPIFNYGRLINQVRVQDAKFQQAILNYEGVVLNAQREVQDALSGMRQSARRVEILTRTAEAARRSAKNALSQYEAGSTDYTAVVIAEQARLAVEDNLALSKGSTTLAAIAAYRALGGGWEIRTGRSVLSEDVKSQMAKRTSWGRMLNDNQHLPKENTLPPPAKP